MSPDQSSDVGSGISDNDTCMLSFEAIKSLEEVSAYKYLGVLEADDVYLRKISITATYFCKVSSTIRNSRNTFFSHNANQSANVFSSDP